MNKFSGNHGSKSKARQKSEPLSRRRFLGLAAVAPAALSVACGDDPDKPEGELPADEATSGLPVKRELSRFRGLTSVHDHLDSPEAAEMMLAAMDRTGIARMHLMGCYHSVQHRSKKPDWASAAVNNELLLKVVGKHPDRFRAFALMNGREEDMVATLKDYLSRGASGVKMYNGSKGKHRSVRVNDPALGEFYRFAELHGVPILIHVDPPHLDDFLDVVRDYPAIPWICPHLLCQTKEKSIDRLEQVLRQFPGLHTDMSFGFESWMHANFVRISKSRDRIREIVIEHADQVLFGTDIVFATNKSYRTVDWAANSFTEYRKMLELDRFHHSVTTDKKTYEAEIDGLALPEEVLKKIYVANPERLFKDRTPPRFDRDDLETVLVSLPQRARFDAEGKNALLAVGAAGCLSAIDSLEIGAASGPSRLCTTTALAEPVARALELTGADLVVVEDISALKDLLAANDDAAGVMPFGDLDPRLRAVPVEGIDPTTSFVSRCADHGEATRAAYFGEYPLLLPLTAEETIPPELTFDPHELRTVVFTGTSLLGAGFAKGPLPEPREQVSGVAPLIQGADIAHASVENPAVADCSQKKKKGWHFCYRPDRAASLDYLGVDALDLTGNHLTDFGQKDLRRTLKRYRRSGFAYFGGGRDLEDALRPAVFEVRGLRVGFTGLNRVNNGPRGATADRAGPLVTALDNFDTALAATKEASDVFFFTYQGGHEFSLTPANAMVQYAHRAIDGGAAGAVGVHAHAPMGIEVYRGSFVAYGLGNFLFRHPGTAKPRNPMSEYGLVLMASLYGKTPLQQRIIPVHNEPLLRQLEGEEKEEVLSRVRGASRPGLAPERALHSYTDSFIEIDSRKDTRGLWKIQGRSGLSGMLVGMAWKSAKTAGGAQKAYGVLDELRRRYLKSIRHRIKVAVPLLDGWSLPTGEFDAVRVWMGDDPATCQKTLAAAREAELPIQLVLDRVPPFDALARALAACGRSAVVLSGAPALVDDLPGLASLMRRNRRVCVDTSARSLAELVRWFDRLERDRGELREFFEEFSARVLAATGATSIDKKMGWNQQLRVLRAFRFALEDASYRRPLLDKGSVSEWRGYPYHDEPIARGMELKVPIVDALFAKNFERIFG